MHVLCLQDGSGKCAKAVYDYEAGMSVHVYVQM